MDKCPHCGLEITKGAKTCPHCNKEIEQKDTLINQVKTAVADSVKTFKDEVGKKIEEAATAVKTLATRVEAIEKLPALKDGKAPAFGHSSKYLGYNLNHQLRGIRNIAAKNPSQFPMFSNDEASENYAKWLLAHIAFRKNGDMEARKVMLEIAQKTNQMQEDTAAEGGYLVPQEYGWDIIQLARERTFCLQYCDVIQMSRSIINLPSEASLAAVAWTAEEGGITAGEATVGTLQLTAKRLDGYARVTNELLQDTAIDISGMLTEQFSYATLLELDNQVLNGTGSPCSGVLTAKAGYSVILSGDDFSTITGTDLSLMIQKVVPGLEQGNGLFVIGTLGLHYIRTLKDTTNNFIFAPPGANVPGTIWQKPYFVSTNVTNTSAASTALGVFGNFKYFKIGNRVGAMSLEVDPYGLFTTNATRFRMITRWALGLGSTGSMCRVLTSS